MPCSLSGFVTMQVLYYFRIYRKDHVHIKILVSISCLLASQPVCSVQLSAGRYCLVRALNARNPGESANVHELHRVLDLIHTGFTLGGNWLYLIVDHDTPGPLGMHW